MQQPCLLKLLRSTFSIALFCGSLSVCHAQGSDLTKHPIGISQGGLILVNVTIEDTLHARFILDTGAGIHVVSNNLLRRVVATPQGRFTGFRHSGERVDFNTFQLPAFSLYGVRQEHPIAAVWSLLDSFNIDGILSLKFFEHHPFTLDLQDSLLTFESDHSLAALTASSHAVPLKIHDDRGTSLDVFVDVRVANSLRLECILDTGSPGSMIDARYLHPLGIDTTSSTVQRRTRKGLFAGVEVEYITTVPTLSLWDIPNLTMKNQPIVFKHNIIYDGLVGTDFLIGKRVTFDIPARRLFLNVD